MGAYLAYYIHYTLNIPHFLEMLFLAAAWGIFAGAPGRQGRVRRVGFFSLGLLAAFLVFDFLLRLAASEQYLLTWLIAQGCCAAVPYFLRGENRCAAGAALWCSMYAATISMAAIGGQISLSFGQFAVNGLWQGLTRAGFTALTVPLAIYFNSKRLTRYTDIPFGVLMIILVGDVCLFVLRILEGNWLIPNYTQGGSATIIVGYLCVLILVLCAVYAADSICREQERVLRLTAEQLRTHSEQQLVQLTEKQLEDLRRLRHDLKNQYSCMRILLQERRYDELEDYFAGLDDSLRQLTPELDCGNRAVSVILNMERQKADAAGVALHTSLVVPPVLPFPDGDVCSILSNLIDNAIEECVRLGRYFPKVKEEGVTLSIRPNGDYLYIEVQNPTDRKRLPRSAGGIVSTKADAGGHGLGTRIVSDLAEKYNGSALFEIRDRCFSTRVILDLMSAGKEEES